MGDGRMGDGHEIISFSPKNPLPLLVDLHPWAVASAAAPPSRQQS